MANMAQEGFARVTSEWHESGSPRTASLGQSGSRSEPGSLVPLLRTAPPFSEAWKRWIERDPERTVAFE
jgi:hypothetical protein